MNITTRRRHDQLGARPGLVLAIEMLIVVMLGAAACTPRSADRQEGSRTPATSPSLGGVGAASLDKAALPTPSSSGYYLVNIRTGEITRLPVGNPGWPDVSADGRLIAWAGGRVSKIDGFDLHRVGATGTRDWGPAGAMGTRPDWSPDGTMLAVDTSTFEVNGSIFIINLRSGHTRRVRTVGEAPYAAEWAPDGTRILYLSPRGVEDQEIRVVDLVTGVDTRLRRVDGSLGFPWGNLATWSPDGRRIAYECDTGICSIRADGSHMQMLTCCPMVMDHSALAPQWSPDGTMIAYWCDGCSDSDEDASDVFVMDLASGRERLIMESAEDPVWAGEDTLIVRTWGS